MFNIKQFPLLFLHYLCTASPAHAMDDESKSVSIRDDFLHIHHVSQALLTICPPQRCVIVGVGQSPTPFIAYLQNEIKNYAYAIPLSEFRYGVYNNPLDDEETSRLYQHFDHFLPKPEKLQNRSILLLDYASQSGGITMMSVVRYMESYLIKKYPGEHQNPPTVEIAVIKENINIERIPYRFNYIFLFEESNCLLNNIKNNIYKDISPYGSFYVKEVNEEAQKLLCHEFVELKQSLRLFKNQLIQFKNQLQQKYGYATEPTPAFKLIQQSGKLDFNLVDANHIRDITWYVNQLRYAQGAADLDARFDELFAHPRGKQELLKEWQIFKFQPRNQRKILNKILKDGNNIQLEIIINNIDDVSEDIVIQCIKSLVDKGNDELIKNLAKNVPLLCGEIFLIIFDELNEDDRFQPITDTMLDHYLMPDLFFNGTNSSTLEEHILERFRKLLDSPEAKTLALRKLKEYTNEKTSLPRITMLIPKGANETAPRKEPASNDFHNSFRNSLLNKIDAFISTYNDD